MASSDPSQYEKELGTTVEEDLAAILGSQVQRRGATNSQAQGTSSRYSIRAGGVNQQFSPADNQFDGLERGGTIGYKCGACNIQYRW